MKSFEEHEKQVELTTQIIAEIEKTIKRKETTFNTDNYVVMANNMILHSASNLTLNELKLLRLVIMQTEKDETELYTYTFPAKQLAELLEINTKDFYKKLKTMSKNLMQEVIFIGDDTKKAWRMFHWVEFCQYEKGQITIKLSNELKPFLLHLYGNFTRYELSEIIKLKSIYAIKIYETLFAYMNDNNKPYADNAIEISVSIDELRRVTNTEKKFERYSSFKTKVIDIALNAINEKSKYHITATPYKSGNAIKGYDFLIESRAGYFHRISLQGDTEENKNNISGQMNIYDYEKETNNFTIE